MNLVDLNESYQNILKSPHIVRKKWYFYEFKNRDLITYVIQLFKGYQNHIFYGCNILQIKTKDSFCATNYFNTQK
jgi:hypothetical protein